MDVKKAKERVGRKRPASDRCCSAPYAPRERAGAFGRGGAHGHAESSGAFLAFAEPPYWMRIASAHSAETLSLSHSRSFLCVSCACSAEAETPVPMAQTCETVLAPIRSKCGRGL